MCSLNGQLPLSLDCSEPCPLGGHSATSLLMRAGNPHAKLAAGHLMLAKQTQQGSDVGVVAGKHQDARAWAKAGEIRK